MHELGIASNIVAIVAEAANGRSVRHVTVEIGKLSGVMAEAIAFCFDVVAEGTCVQGAELEIREIEGFARCLSCAAEFSIDCLLTPCACGSHRLAYLRGEELNVKSMEIMEAA